MRSTHALDGKVVVVTGASSGFGKGAARAFAEKGARVVLAARRAELLRALAVELEQAGHEALDVPTDVSRKEEVERLAQTVVARFGRIDVWINDAGVGVIGPFAKVPLDDHVKVIETNLLGTLYGSYFAYRQFLVQGSGVLLNVASELGRHTVPYYTSYAAAKHGVVGLDDALQQELLQRGSDAIHVCTVLPTAHDTPFFEHAGNYTGHEVQAPKPLHDPQAVVEALLKLAVDPKDNDIVGADGIAKVVLKNLAPGLAKKAGARQMHATQMKGPPAEDTPGAVQSPMSSGVGVKGGLEDRS